jgi:16S rRNA (cytosine967-C5)-methyltransferase
LKRPLSFDAFMPGSPSAASEGLAARQVAWQVLQSVAAGAFADGALDRELNRQSLAPADRALATELAYGAIRQRRVLDAWLDQLGHVPADRQPPKLRWLLHIGLYQLLQSERVPAAAAVHTTVELAKRAGLGRLAPVANAVLRGFLRRQQVGDALAAPQDAAQALALRQSLPDWLAAELLVWQPAERAEAFARACNQPPALDLRVNRLRTTPQRVLASLAAAGIQARPIEGLPWGVTLPAGSGDLRALPGYQEGFWCVQDRTAQRIAPLLSPQPGEWILDACAAPGGKTTHLAELSGGQAQVLAVDRGDARLRRLQRNADRLGMEGITQRCCDAATLATESPELRGGFDRILVDAPCSGLGTLARHADARWRIMPEAIGELVVLQRRLLDGLLPLLKPGGHLLYATCSVHPAENDHVVESFLRDHPRVVLKQRWQHWPGVSPEEEQAPGPPADGVSYGEGDGFFAALLQA